MTKTPISKPPPVVDAVNGANGVNGINGANGINGVNGYTTHMYKLPTFAIDEARSMKVVAIGAGYSGAWCSRDC